ncbi:hypothetical protein SBOR_9432 [Sclerotinia borealis F-4128]|uniref:Uncharacterized protein n=1 Tax=Sclerotinia borealis (strain F-4128) TaxID=1432307 RepID=W9C5J1_SCLBF|nr:hypothetical protein SBOR_9432 [Sclerotinia borealis F-4128]
MTLTRSNNLIISFILVALSLITVTKGQLSTSTYSTEITVVPVYATPTNFLADASARDATYTISTVIAHSTHTGTFRQNPNVSISS